MARGQAFETMMLVISVIVALAILGVLLSILGGFSGGFGGDPKSTMKDNFRDLHSSGGIGISAPKKVTFKSGVVVVADELVTNLPIIASQIQFVCEDTSVCDPDKLELADNILTANADIEVNLVTCANEQKDNGDADQNYFAAISRANNPSKATSDCKTAADIGGN